MIRTLAEKMEDVLINIRNQRIKLDYSQKRVADHLNISLNAYRKLEIGYTELSVVRLYEIAESLGITPKELLACNTLPFISSKDRMRLSKE